MQQTDTQVEQPMVWTVAPSTNTPYEFGRFWGTTGEAAQAAMWHSRTADMIDHLAGYLETHAAQDDKRRSAQMLFDQLTLPQDDCASYADWRYGA